MLPQDLDPAVGTQSSRSSGNSAARFSIFSVRVSHLSVTAFAAGMCFSGIDVSRYTTVLAVREARILAKIAQYGVTRPPDDQRRSPDSRVIAEGRGWRVMDVVCEAGPEDRPFEEQHEQAEIAIVLRGSFEYRTDTGNAAMVPGSILLGNAGRCFCCGHEHGTGDRCLSFSFSAAFLEQATQLYGGPANFGTPRIPPLRETAGLVASAAILLNRSGAVDPEELSVLVAGQSIRIASGLKTRDRISDSATVARITRVVRMIDNEPDAPNSLGVMAHLAGLSPYYFLRAFEGVTGATPHQYLLRSRLRRAAVMLRTGGEKVLDVAFDCGFGDVSNFNRCFRSEFGLSPRRFRQASAERSLFETHERSVLN